MTAIEQVSGQITLTATEAVTPVGTFPMIGTRWSVDETWETYRERPGWAIVLGMLTWWTGVGVAFFFVTTTRHWGQVTITMHAANGAWWREPIQIDSPQLRSQLVADVIALDNWSLEVANRSQSA